MEKLILCLPCLCSIGPSALCTVPKGSRINTYFYEQYAVSKSDKKVRHGAYQLNFLSKPVATGSYMQGKRTGIWHFYTGDTEEQQYDYTNNKLIKNTPDKTNVSCLVEYMLAGDTMVPPAMVGGYTAGFTLMKSYTSYRDDVTGLTGDISIDHVISLDNDGKMTDWMMKIKSDGGVKVARVTFDNVPEVVKQFLPAVLNGKAVASVIIFNERASITMRMESRSVRSRGDGVPIDNGRRIKQQ